MEVGQSIQDRQAFLTSLIELATPILTFLLNRYEKRLDNQEQKGVPSQQDRQVSLSIENATVVVEPEDLNDDERLLRKLLESQPGLADNVSAESSLRIDVQVSPNQPTKKR